MGLSLGGLSLGIGDGLGGRRARSAEVKEPRKLRRWQPARLAFERRCSREPCLRCLAQHIGVAVARDLVVE
jgi:hypothetical protein